MATTWSPTDKANCSLSGVNLIATGAGSAGGVRSTTTKVPASGGKWYFEFSNIALGGSNSGLGVAKTTWPLTNTSNSNDIMSHVTFGSVRNGVGGTYSFTDGDPSTHVLSVALDFDLLKTWWRIDANNWNNDASANPATGAFGGVLSTYAMTSSDAVAIAVAFSTGTEHVTLNAGGSAFAQSVPAGFVGWDAVQPVYLRRPLVIF